MKVVKKTGKKCKSRNGKKPADPDAAFNSFLNDIHYVSPVTQAMERDRQKARIYEILRFFEIVGSKAIDIRELGVVLRELGFNVTQSVVSVIASIAQDPVETTLLPFSKLEPVLLNIVETHEFCYEAQLPDGTSIQKRIMLYRDPEQEVQRAFDSLWDALGRKTDAQQRRYLDSGAVRELLTSGKASESFSREEVERYLSAVQEIGRNIVDEDQFVSLALE